MIIKLTILAIIIYIKGIFSAGETAFTYLNKAKFNQMSKNAKKKSDTKIIRIKKLLDNKLGLFGTTKVGLTLLEIFVSAFAAEAFVAELVVDFEAIGINTMLGYMIAIIIITIILSYFTLVFGELIPKRIARNNPEKIAYKTVNFLTAFSKINYIFEKILVKSENLFSRIFGIKNEPKENLTEKEIKLIIAEGKDQGIFDNNEKKLLYNALKFDTLIVKDIMILKEKMVCINVKYAKEKILEKIKKYKYTRIPVYSGTKDNIIGILNVKDILLKAHEEDGKLDIELENLLRDPIFITKNDKIDEIFKTMQLNNKHIAIVKNEDGHLEGMITMEDIIEKLLGNILDEFDK